MFLPAGLFSDDYLLGSLQRYFVISRSPLLGGVDAMRDSEVGYAIEAIAANPENESPWRYLRGLFKGHADLLISDGRVSEACLKVLKTSNQRVFALSLLLDLLCHGLQPREELRETVQRLRSEMDLPLGGGLPAAVCSILEKMDQLRVNYWAWRRTNLPPEAI